MPPSKWFSENEQKFSFQTLNLYNDLKATILAHIAWLKENKIYRYWKIKYILYETVYNHKIFNTRYRKTYISF